MSEIPEDIKAAVQRLIYRLDENAVWGDGNDWGLRTEEATAILTEALLAERQRATAAERERCAKIADHGVKWSPPIGGGVERWIDESCARIAAAIRKAP